MNYQELRFFINEFEKICFKIGLSIWIEGAHSFYGNLRLLLDPFKFMENEIEVYTLVEKHRFKFGFIGLGETTFVRIS
jgi:hypothetical protein